QLSALPEASTPRGNWPAEQFVPFTAKLVAVPDRVAVIVPAVKLPLPSRCTTALAVLMLATAKPFLRIFEFAPFHCGINESVLVAGPSTSPLPEGVKQPWAFPLASIPAAACPAAQLVPSAARAVAVAALPVMALSVM